MAKVLASLTTRCDLGPSSCLVDIGAGLARPLLHAAIVPGVRKTVGIEVDSIKVIKAEAFVERVCTRLRKKGLVRAEESEDEGESDADATGGSGTEPNGARCDERGGFGPAASSPAAPSPPPLAVRLAAPAVRCADLLSLDSLPSGTTHAYSFWEGIPVDARRAFGRLAASCETLEAVAVVQRAIRSKTPEQAMTLEWCFPQLSCVDSFSVSMSGSGRSFTAYVFRVVGRGRWASDPVPAVKGATKPQAHVEDVRAGRQGHVDGAQMPTGMLGALKAIEAAASGEQLQPLDAEDDLASILTPDPADGPVRPRWYAGDEEVSCRENGSKNAPRTRAAVKPRTDACRHLPAAGNVHPPVAVGGACGRAKAPASTTAPRRSARLASRDTMATEPKREERSEMVDLTSARGKSPEHQVRLEERASDARGLREASTSSTADDQPASPGIGASKNASAFCSDVPRVSTPPSSPVPPRKRPSPTKTRDVAFHQRRALSSTAAYAPSSASELRRGGRCHPVRRGQLLADAL